MEQFTISKSLYMKLESCERKPQRYVADRGDELYRTPGAFVRLYKEILTEPHPEWFGPCVEFEDRATAITLWEQRVIPGLLQTEAYANSVVRAGRPYDPPEAVDLVVRGRLERQQILARDRPPKLWAVIAEGVLRQLIGGREVMNEQLDHLVELSESSRVVIQVFPYSAVDAPGTNGPAVLFEFSDQQPVAYLEGWEAGRIVEEPEAVADIAAALNMIKGCALSPGDSQQLIAEIRG